MSDDKHKDIITRLKAEHDVRRANMPKCARCGNQTEGQGKAGLCKTCAVHFANAKRMNAGKSPWSPGAHNGPIPLEVADRLYQAAHKDRITLPRIAWLRRPAPDASPVPRSALISPQSGATLIGSAKSRRRI